MIDIASAVAQEGYEERSYTLEVVLNKERRMECDQRMAEDPGKELDKVLVRKVVCLYWGGAHQR